MPKQNKGIAADVVGKKAPVGATGGGGFRFENLVAARFLLDMLGSTHTLGAEHFGRVLRVDWQARDQGWLADDLAVTSTISDQSKVAALSIKSAQGVTNRGFPTEFVGVAWAQWSRTDAPNFRNTGDVLVFATGDGGGGPHKAWATLLSEILSTAPDRIVSRLASDRSAGVQSSAVQRNIFASFAPPEPFEPNHIGDEETVALIRKVRWIDFDFGKPDSQAFGRAIYDSQDALDAFDASRAKDLWERLIGIADEMRQSGGTLDLPALLDRLRGSFALKHHPAYSSDWALLNKHTRNELADVRTSIVGVPSLDRIEELNKVKTALRESGACLLVGDSGSGKSALVKTFAANEHFNVIWLNAANLEVASCQHFEKACGLRHDIGEIANASPQPALFVFDAIEGLSESGRKTAFQILGKLHSAIASGRAKVILTAQSEATPGVIRGLATNSAPKSLLEPTVLARVRESDVRDLIANVPSIRWVSMRPELRSLLTNLKILDWFILSSTVGVGIDANTVLGMTTLIDALWQHLVESGSNRYAKSALLIKIAGLEADNQFNGVPRSFLDHSEQLTLDTVETVELLRIRDERVWFSHDLLSDWARLRTLISADWLTDISGRERFITPRWYRAVRLYGQWLLEQTADGPENWRQHLSKVQDGTTAGTLLSGLLIESLFLAPNAAALLEQSWNVLAADNAALLRVLLERFLYVATLPDPRLPLMVDAGQDVEQFEHAIRIPYYPYWRAVIALLYAHRTEVVRLVPRAAADVCAMWLRHTQFQAKPGYTIALRRETAELALLIAREVQAQNEAGPYGL